MRIRTSLLRLQTLAVVGVLACGPDGGADDRRTVPVPGSRAGGLAQRTQGDDWETRRQRMVEDQLRRRGVSDDAVLRAMLEVPRHEFVPSEHRRNAYADRPLPIGLGQTISQPYVVAYMTEQLDLAPTDTVLEVGTGSGYQAAVLGAIVARVYTIEIFEELAEAAERRLARLGYGNAEVRHGDGWFGWPEHAPFDAIIVTAAAGQIPPPLVEQLKPGGRMAIPVGSVYGVQNLVLVQKDRSGAISTRNLMPVRFVPLLRGER